MDLQPLISVLVHDFTLGLAAIGLLFAGIVKGATGLGYATIALPFLIPAVGLQTAMALVLAPAIATNIGVALGAGHLKETASRFGVFYLATLPGIAAGVALLTLINPEWATRFLGLSIFLFAVLSLNQPALAMPPRLSRWLQGPAGLATGLLTGLTGAQVMPLLPFMMAQNLGPDRLVQAINLSVLICSTALAAILLASGVVAWPLIAASLAALPLALGGVWIGVRLRAYLPQQIFRSLMLVVVLAMGFALAAR